MSVFNDIERAYFIGAGGIGMSAVARYLKFLGIHVAGYDRVSTPLTDSLSREGISVHFTDDPIHIPEDFHQKQGTLVVYTPAIPDDHRELNFFRKNDFLLMKRSEALGAIMKAGKGIAVAGTHGKTSVSSMIAHILDNSTVKCNAFLGGINKNLKSNLLIGKGADYTVVEADEFDRSFLRLYPEIEVITSIDPDHLDIYGTYENLLNNFNLFVEQLNQGGLLIYKEGLPLQIPEGTRRYTYHMYSESADYYIKGMRRDGFRYSFELKTPDGIIENLQLGVYGKVNLENAIAAIAVAMQIGATVEEIRKGISSFAGVNRRFDVIIEGENRIFIDDYAHHPEELRAFISSVRDALPGKIITGIFQPHLYTRTRDFANGFAESLSLLDNVILLDIYPAREKPIEGISSAIILDKLVNKGKKMLLKPGQLFLFLKELNPEVLLTIGAGDIDQLVEPLRSHLMQMDNE